MLPTRDICITANMSFFDRKNAAYVNVCLDIIPHLNVFNFLLFQTACNETFKNHETNKTQYMMKYAEGVWETFDCPPNLGSGLVWRQDLCSCGEELVAQDPDDWCGQMGYRAHNNNKHKYIRVGTSDFYRFYLKEYLKGREQKLFLFFIN